MQMLWSYVGNDIVHTVGIAGVHTGSMKTMQACYLWQKCKHVCPEGGKGACRIEWGARKGRGSKTTHRQQIPVINYKSNE